MVKLYEGEKVVVVRVALVNNRVAGVMRVAFLNNRVAGVVAMVDDLYENILLWRFPGRS